MSLINYPHLIYLPRFSNANVNSYNIKIWGKIMLLEECLIEH